MSQDPTQLGIFRPEAIDLFVQRSNDLSDVRCVEFLRDVLGTVDVPGFDFEEDHLFGSGRVILRHQLSDQRRIILDNSRAPPDLDTAPVA